MKRRIVSAALSALLAAALTACGPAPAEPTATPEPTPTVTPTPTPEPTPEPLVDPVLSSRNFAETYTADDGTVVLTVSYTLPDFENKGDSKVLTAIADWYEEEGESLLDSARTRSADAKSDYEVSTAAGIEFSPVLEEIKSELSYQSDGVLSFRREFYAGGAGMAHPTVLRMGEQFARTDGHKLTFADCVTDGLAAADAALSYLTTHGTVGELVSAGTVTADAVEAAFQPDHFYLTEEGFTFWFQPGELSGVSGNSPIETVVPYSVFEELLQAWIV